MGREWGRDFEAAFGQHGRGRGRRRDEDWVGPWGTGMWGPPHRRSGPPPWIAGLFGMAAQQHGRGPRVRRGDVRVAILAVLTDGPLNGYQVIQEIADRTDGAWRPSPGSVYPTISQLEDEGLIEGDDERGRRTLRLSAAGRDYLAEHEADVAQVWAPFAEDAQAGRPDDDAVDFASLKPELGRVMNAVWQIITTGTDDQRRAAIGVLLEARRGLYQILADHPGEEIDDLGDRGDRDTDPEEEW